MDNLLSISRRDSSDFDLGGLDDVKFTRSADDELDQLFKMDSIEEMASSEDDDFGDFEGFEDIDSIDTGYEHFTDTFKGDGSDEDLLAFEDIDKM